MRRNISIIAIILLFLINISSCAQNPASNSTEEVTISAAASLKQPLDEIITKFEADTNIRVNINYGSSGSLQKQIEQGASVDIFLSAGKRQVQSLLDEGLADKASYKELLANSLVLIVSKSYDSSVDSLQALKNRNIRLAIGEINTVPAGQYAREYLEKTGLWSAFSDKLVYAKDVKAVVSYVEAGDAQAGIVYCSDAVKLENSYVAYEIPDELHSSIIYPVVDIYQGVNDKNSKNFMDYLQKQDVKSIFEKYKFKVKE